MSGCIFVPGLQIRLCYGLDQQHKVTERIAVQHVLCQAGEDSPLPELKQYTCYYVSCMRVYNFACGWSLYNKTMNFLSLKTKSTSLGGKDKLAFIFDRLAQVASKYWVKALQHGSHCKDLLGFKLTNPATSTILTVRNENTG